MIIWPSFQSSLTRNIQKMEKKVFIEDSFVETQTRFFENGKVVTDFCEWEQGKTIVPDGNKQNRQRGTLVTTDGVGVTFNPFNTGGSPLYTQLYNTKHAVVQHSTKTVIVKFKLPKKMGKNDILKALEAEAAEIRQYIRTIKKGGVL